MDADAHIGADVEFSDGRAGATAAPSAPSKRAAKPVDQGSLF
jgi:hypothetical protein